MRMFDVGVALTLVLAGGTYQEAQETAYIDDFAAQPHIGISTWSSDNELAGLRAQHETDTGTWDVIDMFASHALAACERGYLAPLPSDIEGDEFIASTKCSVGHVVYSVAVGYLTEGNDPATAADFFNLDVFPGRRGLKRSPQFTLEFALIADGVSPANVYTVLATDAGIERALAKLTTIRDQIVWWVAGAQAPQLLRDGEVTMTTAYSGRLSDLDNADTLWDGQVIAASHWGVPANAPNMEQAWSFVRYATEAARNRALVDHISYGPGRLSVASAVPPDVPTHPDNMTNAAVSSPRFWADHGERINKRFTAWLINGGGNTQ